MKILNVMAAQSLYIFQEDVIFQPKKKKESLPEKL